MGTPKDRIPAPGDASKWVTPTRESDPNVGWREFIRGLIPSQVPDNIIDLIIPGTEEARTRRARERIGNRVPYDAFGPRGSEAREREINRLFEMEQAGFELQPDERNDALSRAYRNMVPEDVRANIDAALGMPMSSLPKLPIGEPIAPLFDDVTLGDYIGGAYDISGVKGVVEGRPMEFFDGPAGMAGSIALRVNHPGWGNIIVRGENLAEAQAELARVLTPNKVRGPITRQDGSTVIGGSQPEYIMDDVLIERNVQELVEGAEQGQWIDGEFIPQEALNITDELVTGEGSIGAGFDQSLLKKLGANLYKGSVPSIAVKEVIQNSVDSVRGLGGGGKIDVTLDIDNRLINISDNGTGMSPATASKEFMDVGGSLKSEGSSGGYGLAKVGIFSQADHISVETVALVDGKKVYTTIKGSGDDWINGKLKINSNVVEDAVPTGTRMELKLNEEVAGKSDNWYEARSFLNEFENHNLLEGTQVNITGHNMYGIKAKSVVDAYGDPIDTIELPNATVDVYASKVSDKAGWVTPRILNKGLYQFNQTPMHLEHESPRSLIFDVKSKVDVDNPAYPFTTSREELKGDVGKAVNDYMKQLASKMASQRINRIRDIMNSPILIKGSTGGSSIFRLTEDTPIPFARLVANSEYMGPLNDAANLITQDILLALRGIKRFKDIPNVNFGGISLDPGHLGVNIRPKVINDLESSKGLEPLTLFGSDDNVILINPYSILREVRAEMGKFNTKRAAEQTWETLVHEVLHQLAGGHSEDFSGKFTRILHAIIPNGGNHIKELQGIYSFASKNDMGQHAAEVITLWGNNAKQESIFKGLTGH